MSPKFMPRSLGQRFAIVLRRKSPYRSIIWFNWASTSAVFLFLLIFANTSERIFQLTLSLHFEARVYYASRPEQSIMKEPDMPRCVIERDIPGAGNLSSEELRAISQKSCGVLNNMGPQIQWVQSFVTGY